MISILIFLYCMAPVCVDVLRFSNELFYWQLRSRFMCLTCWQSHPNMKWLGHPEMYSKTGSSVNDWVTFSCTEWIRIYWVDWAIIQCIDWVSLWHIAGSAFNVLYRIDWTNLIPAFTHPLSRWRWYGLVWPNNWMVTFPVRSQNLYCHKVLNHKTYRHKVLDHKTYRHKVLDHKTYTATKC
jgi:hypothetical protein